MPKNPSSKYEERGRLYDEPIRVNATPDQLIQAIIQAPRKKRPRKLVQRTKR